MGMFDEQAIDVLHNTDPGHDKIYIGRVDVIQTPGGQTKYQAICSYGAAGRPRLSDHHKGTFDSLAQAARVVQDILDRKVRDGYQRVGDPGYRGNLPRSRCIAKIDTSLTVGFVETPEQRPTPPRAAAALPVTRHAQGRAARTISI